MTFGELSSQGQIPAKKLFGDYGSKGFDTPSGKVELYSEQLEEWGFDPLPTYRSPLRADDDYPLLVTSWKVGPFVHSGNREVQALRRLHPHPMALVNEKTARTYGIHSGEPMVIETRKGRMVHIARLNASVSPGVVIAEHGWWFPERAPLDGWDESNFNVLTSRDRPYAREMGSSQLRGLPCRISPLDR